MKPGAVMYCGECSAPWGAHGHDRDDDLRAAFAEWWADRWADDIRFDDRIPDDTPPPDPGPLPGTVNTYAVHITEASARWLDEIGHEVGVEAPCWLEVGDWSDVPSWWANPRRRPITRWNCCDGLPSDPFDAAGLYDQEATP